MPGNINVVFIHIPKTAGRFIQQALDLERLVYPRRAKRLFRQKGRVSFGHQDYLGLIQKGIVSRQFDETAFKFTFCRNPFDRLVSHYFYTRHRYPDFLPRGLTFSDFATNLDKYNKIKAIREGVKIKCFRPQAEAIKGIDIDFVGRFEMLHADVVKVASIIGAKIKDVGIVGATRHEPYRTYYDAGSEESVRRFYQEDFEHFGYDDHLLH